MEGVPNDGLRLGRWKLLIVREGLRPRLCVEGELVQDGGEHGAGEPGWTFDAHADIALEDGESGAGRRRVVFFEGGG